MVENNFSLAEINPLELLGVNNARFNQIREAFPEITFISRGSDLKIRGDQTLVLLVTEALENMVDEIKAQDELSDERFLELLGASKTGTPHREKVGGNDLIVYGVRGNLIKARTSGQAEIVAAAQHNDIVFAIGPAGTGKTYVAVALAVKALKEKQVKKIVLVRPAVEAGENLGFLPGDLREKVDPYLRPLHDALEDMLHFEKLQHYFERNIIEIAPLAYMRGRTLSGSFIILDEAQNATENQFKMILTRLGKESKIIITGDDSQVDLPYRQRSGLIQCQEILQNIEGIAFVRMKNSDVVRHKLVKKIIQAYKKTDKKE